MSGIFTNGFPYTDFHELNLSWVIKTMTELINEVENFVSLNAIKYANPIQWNITSQYEKNTIVIDPQTGTAYISVKPVPLGVSLSDTNYWTVVFDLKSFVVRAAKNFTSRYEEDTTTTATFNTSAGEWLVWGDTLYRANVNITAGDSYVEGGNITKITVEEIKNEIMNTMDALYTEISDRVGDLADLTTSDGTSIVNAINSIITERGSLSDLTTSDVTSIVNAINSIITERGALSDLTTSDKDSVVDAINEVNGVSNKKLDDYVVVNGVEMPIHITSDTTYNVPSQFSSANDAIQSYLKYCIIGKGVKITIQYADGTYYGEQLSAHNLEFDGLIVKGNETNPQNCIIYLDYDPNFTPEPGSIGYDCGFDIQNCNVELISGFHVIGRGMRSVDGNGHVQWIRTYQQCGVNCWNGGICKVKSMICESMYYPYQIGNGSFMCMTSDENYLNGIGSKPTISNISNYYGKYCIALNGGDVGVFVYNNSGAECQGVISLANEDYSEGLGHGFISEHGSGVKCYGCASGYNFITGATSSDGSGLSWLNNGQLYNNGFQGFCARCCSGGEIFDCEIYENATDGILTLDTSSVVCGGLNVHNNQNGITIRFNSMISFLSSNNVSANNTYHDILAIENGTVDYPNNITASSPNGIRFHISEGSSAPTSTGYHSVGDRVYYTSPSTYIGSICTVAGNPGTWKDFGEIAP